MKPLHSQRLSHATQRLVIQRSHPRQSRMQPRSLHTRHARAKAGLHGQSRVPLHSLPNGTFQARFRSLSERTLFRQPTD